MSIYMRHDINWVYAELQLKIFYVVIFYVVIDTDL